MASYTERYDLLEKITMQYKGLQCDSLLLYNYKMVDVARENHDSRRLVNAQIQLARTQIKTTAAGRLPEKAAAFSNAPCHRCG